MNRSLPVLLIATIMLAACSPFLPTPLATPSLPNFGKTWTLRMDLSGGIVGLSQSIEITSDGKFIARDEGAEKSIEGQLSPAELAQLQELIRTLEPVKVTGVEQTGCADCFIYTLDIQGEGKSLSSQVNDITLADSGLAPLATFLRGVMQTALA